MTGAAVSTPSSPKGQLLQRVFEYLSERGVGDVSLRELAAAIGTSHRMLSYHFGSKEGVLVEVAREAERRQRILLADLFEESDGDLAELARGFWRRLRSPELAPLERLFFELYGQGLQGRPHTAEFLTDIVDSWIEPAIPAFKAAGLTESDARAEARLGLAVVRGLLLDVLATGEVAGVDEAFEKHLAGQSARLPRPDPQSALPPEKASD